MNGLVCLYRLIHRTDPDGQRRHVVYWLMGTSWIRVFDSDNESEALARMVELVRETGAGQ